MVTTVSPTTRFTDFSQYDLPHAPCTSILFLLVTTIFLVNVSPMVVLPFTTLRHFVTVSESFFVVADDCRQFADGSPELVQHRIGHGEPRVHGAAGGQRRQDHVQFELAVSGSSVD